jgi:UPF0176 protein
MAYYTLKLDVDSNFQILLYYKYVDIADPKLVMEQQKELCQLLELKGRIIVAAEGINGTLEGTIENTEKYIHHMQADQRFADIKFKRSPGTGSAFPKLSVKVRSEIVSTHLAERDIDPKVTTGKYLTAEELHEWFEAGVEFYIVDMRNDYEHASGHFINSVLPGLKNFRDLSVILPELEHLKGKKIVTVCTGGVRCEKASGFLVANGFADVYQLKDGIVTYMEKYPNQHFLGKLYVFDGRILMGFNTNSPEHIVVGKCAMCGNTAENYTNCAYDPCHSHFICCEACMLKHHGQVFCSNECAQNQAQLTDKTQIYALKYGQTKENHH